MGIPNYYCITTRRFLLRCSHRDWLENTQRFYNQIVSFYYDLFMDLEETGENIHKLNAQQAMRRLEVLTIKGRDKEPAAVPLPWEKIPLYIRRAAINNAVTIAKASLNHKIGIKEKKPVNTFSCAVTFYKGAYRELKEVSVELKVWNSRDWVWLHCRLNGNSLPLNGTTLSPSLIVNEKELYFNIPVKIPVENGKTAKERIQQQAKVCSIQFTNKDTLAVAVVLNQDGEQINNKFFRGGDEYKHRCKSLLEQIKCSEEKMGIKKQCKTALIVEQPEDLIKRQPYNQKYWKKLKHLSEYYAHTISKKMIDYCQEQEADIIILPSYNKEYTKYVMYSVGNWSPLHLSNRIRKLLFYKAWKSGIIVLETSAYGCSRNCSVCGAAIKRMGKNYSCENGHRGNRSLNTACNLGRKCLDSFKNNK